MRDINLNRAIRQAFLPLACLTLLGACAPYEPNTPGVYSSGGATYDQHMALFDRLDTNRDGFLSRAELEPLGVWSAVPAPIESAAATFDRLDTNRDGFLSPAEAGSTFSPIPGGSFAAFDTDRDGFLSRSEAMPHLQWLQNRNMSTVASFEAFDINRDGFLSRVEAEPLLRSTRISGGRYIVGPISWGSFERWDTNRDGYLSRAEAAAAFDPITFDRYDTNRDGFLSRAEAEPLFNTGVGATGGYYGGTTYGPRY